MDLFTIGQVAKATEVTIEVLRHYERCGLVFPVQRSAGGFRQYSEEAIDRVRLIRRVQRLGFALRDIKELVALRDSPRARTEQVQERLQSQAVRLRAEIGRLQGLVEELHGLLGRCPPRRPARESPLFRPDR
ncbi:MAG: MerR family transcriptional regulator [Planctomycetes bacterium]|nr:MerR family transcriptional regulator [Planctomycetota bacterium]